MLICFVIGFERSFITKNATYPQTFPSISLRMETQIVDPTSKTTNEPPKLARLTKIGCFPLFECFNHKQAKHNSDRQTGQTAGRQDSPNDIPTYSWLTTDRTGLRAYQPSERKHPKAISYPHMQQVAGGGGGTNTAGWHVKTAKLYITRGGIMWWCWDPLLRAHKVHIRGSAQGFGLLVLVLTARHTHTDTPTHTHLSITLK